MKDERTLIEGLVAQHEAWRGQTINLIASENAISPAVRLALQTDLLQRYADYSGRDPAARRYRGTRYIQAIEEKTLRIAQQVFRAEYFELRPVSGHLAGAAVLMGLCRPGDLVLEPGRDNGGHREGGKLAASPALPLKVEYLPVDPEAYNLDLPATLRMIEAKRPRLVILGSSNFLFPHPVAEIAQALKSFPDTILVYDASHVMGFLASGKFQDPLREGAQVVFGSTHKTLPGPQGGIIFTNDQALIEPISAAAYPGLVTNHHPFRIPGLALALLEMQAWGPAYCEQIVANAQALGAALEAEGIPCVQWQGRFSRSHTLLMCVNAFGSGDEIAVRLEQAGLITTAAHLPERWGVEGIRIGVQEITRRGAVEKDMQPVARWIAQAVHGARRPEELAQETAAFARKLGPVLFTWSSENGG